MRADVTQADPLPPEETFDKTLSDGPDAAPSFSGPPPAVGRPRAAPVVVGTTIKHYEVIRSLGWGGMSHVYLARDVRLGRLVALKFLQDASPDHERRRFIAEARATAQLNHENIVGFHDIDEHEGALYMVLEYVKGQSLREWAKERAQRLREGAPGEAADRGQLSLPPRRAVEIMLPVVRALACAHDAGIVHRDLKPANVMLADSGAVKVLDFGVAKLVRDAAPPRPADPASAEPAPLTLADAQLTREGAVVGTYAYMAPEQRNGGEVDQRADLWAVGLVLYELVTGRHPSSRGPGMPAWLASVADLNEPMPSVREERSDLGKLGAVIDRCLVKAKADRIGSARELLAELEAALPGRPSTGGDEACPYAGLLSFQEGDADHFFGREQAVAQAVARLGDQPFLAVIGPSGAGKSSFVRAGVIPALKRGGDAWEAFVVRPGPQPLAALAELLLEHAWQATTPSGEQASPPGDGADGDRPALRERLRAEPGHLGALLRGRARRRRQRIVLFVDQFEELLTLARPDERDAFLACLGGAADDAASPLRVVVTLRSDFLDRLAEAHGAVTELLGQSLLLLRPMDRQALRRALMQPAEAADYAFESEALVDEMLDALEHTAGALPLLQFAAAKLWEARDRRRRLLTASSYRALGGVAGTLASHADAVLDAMSQAERDAARAVFVRLVTPERTRALVPMGELSTLAAARQVKMGRVLGWLIDARLLTSAGGGDDGTVELVHESLIERWPTLRGWLEATKEDAAFVERLRRAAADWQKGGEAEGLLWRGDAAHEALRRRTRSGAGGRAELTRLEERYLAAVAALSDRSRRLRWYAVSIAFALLTLVAGAMSFLAWKQQLAQREAAQEALRARDAGRMAAARAFPDDATTRLALLREIEAPSPPPGWQLAVRLALSDGVASVIVYPGTGQLSSVRFSPDGLRVVSAAFDKTVRVWQADGSGEPLVFAGHTDDVQSASFSPDGTKIVSSSHDGTIRVWSVDGSVEPIVLQGHGPEVQSAAFSPDGRRIVSAASDKTVRVWQADGSGEPLVFAGHTDNVQSVAFSPDGTKIVSSSHDKTVRVWAADGPGKSLVLRGHQEAVRSVAFSPDGRRIVSASRDKTLRVWAADGSGEPLVLSGHEGWVNSASFSPDGTKIVSSSHDKTVRVWAADGSGEPLVFGGHKAAVHSAAFSPDGGRIVSASADKSARVWRFDGSARSTLAGHSAFTMSAAFSPDGTKIVSSSADTTLRVWAAGGQSRVLAGHEDWGLAAAFSPDGRRVVSGSGDETVRVWDAESGRTLFVLSGHTAPVSTASFSPDGKRIVSAGGDATIRLWGADGPGPSVMLGRHDQWVRSAAFSPDGRRVASAGDDGTVRLWNVDGSGEPLVLRGHEREVNAVAFRPDGGRLASGGEDGTLRVWPVDGPGEPLVLRGHVEIVSVAFSPDGRRLVAASRDGTIFLRNADGSGEPLVIGAHEGGARSAAFSPDGARVVSAGYDGLVRVWGDLEPLRPSDARLWRATSYCLPPARRQELLGLSALVALAHHDACRRQAAAAGASPGAP